MAIGVIFMYQGPATPIVFGFEPLKAIGLLSIVLSLFVTLIYKFMTDQILMKELKKDLKKHQKHMKEHRKDATKMSELSKKSMETNMKYMMQSFRATFITLIPILLIFGYLNGALTYEPINPAQEFGIGLEFVEGIAGKITTSPPPGLRATGGTERTLTGSEVLFTFEGDPGRYLVEFTVDNKKYTHPVFYYLLISETIHKTLRSQSTR